VLDGTSDSSTGIEIWFGTRGGASNLTFPKNLLALGSRDHLSAFAIGFDSSGSNTAREDS
jgi:hypothetical protein